MLNKFQHLTTNILFRNVTPKQVQGDGFVTLLVNPLSLISAVSGRRCGHTFIPNRSCVVVHPMGFGIRGKYMLKYNILCFNKMFIKLKTNGVIRFLLVLLIGIQQLFQGLQCLVGVPDHGFQG